MTARAARTKVLFIGGEGRSGSTVLERLLSANPESCAIGEGKYLFERGVGSRELCGCGRPVPECELWSEVGDRLVGGWDTAAGRELVDFFTQVNTPRRLPATVAGRGAMVRRAREVLAELYPMIADITGSSVIIDSSKHPSWAFLLAGTETVDLRVVHLVRHPSGVVQSWSRPKERPQAAGGPGEQHMPAQRPADVAFRWDVFNGLFHRLARRSVPTVLVRYEDYVDDIDGTIRACMGLVGLSYETQPIAMGRGHGIAGNPSRFADDGATITVDDRWITELSPARHALVSAMTWHRRAAYGYGYRRSMPVRPLLRHVDGRLVGSGPDGPERSALLDAPEHAEGDDHADHGAGDADSTGGPVVGEVGREKDDRLGGEEHAPQPEGGPRQGE